eukprot:10940272-Prorocentrum_lima.AAC.1
MMSVGRQSLRAPMGVQTPAQRRAKKAQAIARMVQAGSTSRANALLLRNASPYSDPSDYDRIAKCFSGHTTATPASPAPLGLTDQQQEQLTDILRKTVRAADDFTSPGLLGMAVPTL